MTNAKGQRFYDLLRRTGVMVQGVNVLGSFVHVTCKCQNTAERAAEVLAQAGFRLLKITHNIDRAKIQREPKPGIVAPTRTEWYTAHFTV